MDGRRRPSIGSLSVSHFRDALRKSTARPISPRDRQWFFVPYDQLTDQVGPLSRCSPTESGIVIVESTWKPRQRPYHKQKLALVLASSRAFALEQAARGVAVRHLAGDGSYAEQLAPLIEELGPLTMMEAAERELRTDLEPLVQAGVIRVEENETWLSTPEQFAAVFRDSGQWRADRFYRHMRRETGFLMDGDSPEGGQFSFDPENRKRWKGEPPAPSVPRFPIDPIKQEVVDLVAGHFKQHPGRLDVNQLPSTLADAEALWSRAVTECLPCFGPYEDAMSTASEGLFHTRISPLLNNGRLLPRRVVEEVAALDAPIASREGFVRQVLGWREFMRHVHRETDGFRSLPRGHQRDLLGAKVALPDAFWGRSSGLHCLDHVVEGVWQTGYGHHITRLMVLSNLATLLDIDPRALTDWFWCAYLDAYDWVVEPNVLGMGTFSLGDLFTTKPYVSGAAYLAKMSDYCGDCAFSPKRDCPITPMYWDFLARHAETLDGSARMAMPLRSVARRSSEQRAADREVTAWVSATLAKGGQLHPENRP
jgi:deoxyribodipyrimidine photolyase-related protein